MKRIGIIIGSETCPPEDEMKDLRKYYRKHKKQFDESLKFLGLEGVESLSYDVQIFSSSKALQWLHIVPKQTW